MPSKYTHDLARRYSAAFQKRRAALKPIVALGKTPCQICGDLIEMGSPWDLHHPSGPQGPTYPAHRKCNRGEPRSRAAAYDPPPRPTTKW